MSNERDLPGRIRGRDMPEVPAVVLVGEQITNRICQECKLEQQHKPTHVQGHLIDEERKLVAELPESWDELRKYLRPCWSRLTNSLARWKDFRDACDYEQIFEMHAWQACTKWNGKIPLRAWITFVCKRRYGNYMQEHMSPYGQANKVPTDNIADNGHDTILDKLIIKEAVDACAGIWEKRDLSPEKISLVKKAYDKHMSKPKRNRKKPMCPCGKRSTIAGLCEAHYKALQNRGML